MNMPIAWRLLALAMMAGWPTGTAQAQLPYHNTGYPVFQPPTLPTPTGWSPEVSTDQEASENGKSERKDKGDQDKGDQDKGDQDKGDQDKDDDLEARVKALEEAIKKSEEAVKEAKEAASKKPTLYWTGRIHADYWAFPETSPGANFWERGDEDLDVQDRVLFRRIRFGVQGKILQTMEYKSEFDLNNPSAPQLKDVYIGWNELPIFRTVLLGNQKRPYGLDHLNSSRYNVFMERPFVIEAFNQDARRFGVCSYGVSEDERYNWRFGTYFLQEIQNTGSYLVTDDPGLHHYQMEIAGRFANTIWYDECSDGRGYAHWGVSGTIAFPDGEAGARNQARFRTRPEARTSRRWIDTGQIVGADNYELIGLEGVINLGPFQWVTEYQHCFVQREFGGPDVQFGGAYTYVSYFLTGEHIPWERASGTIGRVKPFENFFLVRTCDGGVGGGWGAWQIACRYSFCDFSDGDIHGGIGNNLTFGLNWWWTPYSRLQFNYIYGRIHDRFDQNISSSTGLPSGSIGPTEGDYHIVGMRFMVDF